MKVKAVIFDRDGVLINSTPTHINSVVKTFEELDINITEEEKVYIISKHPTDYVKYFKERYEFSETDFLEAQQSNYIQLFKEDSLNLFDDTILLLKELKAKGFLIGLTTSSDTNTTELFIKRGNLNNIFDAIVTSDECNKKKPDPFPYLLTAQKLNVNPEACVVIEDSDTGLNSAKNANMKCFIIPNDHTQKHDFSKADYVVKNAKEIIKLLNDGN